MSTRPETSRDARDDAGRAGRAGRGEKALPPIRWPHPSRGVYLLIGVWVIGMIIGILVPAFIVAPTERGASTSAIMLAFAISHVGALIMLAVGVVFYRRQADPVAVAFGIVPALAVSTGAFIMAASKWGGF